MALDLAGELLSALRSPEGRRALAEALRPVVAEEIRRALEDREADAVLDTNALAKLLGCSPRALRARIVRGSALGSIVFEIDGRRMWRRSEVMRLLESGRR